MAKKSKVKDEEFDAVMVEIAEKIKELRINAGYSSYENFAWDNGINRMQYWKMEKGETNFTMKSLYRILKVHNMELSDFFGMINISD
ncbi:helix-turn-helix transcriptional regulator [Kordia sp.]|uniref:helix-turn-helix transcriptional regulator n=1 Tax=Kordia sp. TaxID=1965332 RepID=UPI003D29F9B4